MMWSARVKVEESFRVTAKAIDKPGFDSSLCFVALFKIPVARQSQMKIYMMPISRTPRAQVMQINPFGTTFTLQSVNNVAEHQLIGFIHKVTHRLTH